jgi:predicted metal-dependent hydrolase
MFEPETLQTRLGDCTLIRRPRKTLGISVLPDGSLELVAPLDSSPEAILEKVNNRRRWIRKKRAEFAAMNSTRPKLRYCSGATHRYLGRQYRLRVSKNSTNSVKLKNGYFWIETTDTNEKAVKNLLEDWMRDHAEKQFARRLEPWKTWCQRRKLPEPKVRIRKMEKRWGSAQANGNILLNPLLVRAPSICIDYVIAHEICHLKQRNHNKVFYRCLSQNFPNWRSAKLRLEQAEL